MTDLDDTSVRNHVILTDHPLDDLTIARAKRTRAEWADVHRRISAKKHKTIADHAALAAADRAISVIDLILASNPTVN